MGSPKALIGQRDISHEVSQINLWHVLVAKNEKCCDSGMCKMETNESLMQYQRLRWLGHIDQMDDDHLPQQLLFGNLGYIQRHRCQRRPQKSGTDYVRDVLARFAMQYDWYKLA